MSTTPDDAEGLAKRAALSDQLHLAARVEDVDGRPGPRTRALRGGARRRHSTMLGRELIEALVEDGSVPAETRRVVIDASVNEVVVIYVEQVGTRGLLEVLRAVSKAAVRVHEGRPAGPPAERQATDPKGTEQP